MMDQKAKMQKSTKTKALVVALGGSAMTVAVGTVAPALATEERQIDVNVEGRQVKVAVPASGKRDTMDGDNGGAHARAARNRQGKKADRTGAADSHDNSALDTGDSAGESPVNTGVINTGVIDTAPQTGSAGASASSGASATGGSANASAGDSAGASSGNQSAGDTAGGSVIDTAGDSIVSTA